MVEDMLATRPRAGPLGASLTDAVQGAARHQSQHPSAAARRAAPATAGPGSLSSGAWRPPTVRPRAAQHPARHGPSTAKPWEEAT